jgi:hypothetical protein
VFLFVFNYYVLCTVPSQPGSISVLNQLTNDLYISWNQTGRWERFEIRVMNETHGVVPSCSNNPCVNQQCSSVCNATISNLATAGKTYHIEVVAITDTQRSTAQTTNEQTRKFFCQVTVILFLLLLSMKTFKILRTPILSSFQ